jgi:hypothetical protein
MWLVGPGEAEVFDRPKTGWVVQLDARLEFVVRDTAVPLAQGDAQLAAGEVRAEAAVDAATEGQVTVDVPVEADVRRVGKLDAVDVGRPDQYGDQ